VKAITTTDEIERKELRPIEVPESLRNLGDQAARVLGYRVLQKKTVGVLPPLAQALAELEIEVLDPVQVVSYQESVLDKLEGRKPGKVKTKMVEEDYSKDDEEESEDDDDDDEEDVPSTVPSANVKVRRSGRFRWVAIPINRYRFPIPEFALRKAIQIRQAVPEAEIFVEQVTQVPRPDPFLVVKFRRERYTVEVWGEPGFESKLLK
jgi:hypothetical protein